MVRWGDIGVSSGDEDESLFRDFHLSKVHFIVSEAIGAETAAEA